MSRDRESEHVRHRAADDEDAARVGRKTGELREPRDHLMFDERRRVIEAGHVRIERRREHVREHRQRHAAPLNPSPETGMDVAVRIRQHALGELAIRGVRAFAARRQRLVKRRANLIRHRPPRRPLTNRREVVDHVVDHLVRERAECVPVGGVERLRHRSRRYSETSSRF